MSGIRLLLVALCLSLAVGRPAARAATLPSATKGLLIDLRKAVAEPAPAAQPDPRSDPAAPANRSSKLTPAQLAVYVDQLEILLSQPQFAEAQQLLTRLRQMVPAENLKASAAIDALVTSVQAEVAALSTQQDAAYTALADDFAAKFEKKAPGADFDDLIARLAPSLQSQSYSNLNAQKLVTLGSMVVHWQDYLLQSAHGRADPAAWALDQFIRENTLLAIVPRSQVVMLQASRPTGARPASEAQVLIKSLQVRLGELLTSAKTAADLDAFVVETARVTIVTDANSEFRAIRRCATLWQGFFVARETGNVSDANAYLSYFKEDRDFDPIFPYSSVKLKLFGPVDPEFPLAATLIPPAELTPANIMELDWQIRYRRDHNLSLPFPPETIIAEFSALRSPISGLLEDNVRFVLEGAATWNRAPDPAKLGDYAGALARVKTEMLHKAVRIYLNWPATPRPEPNDSYGAYADRLLPQYYQQPADWPTAYRLLSVKVNAKGASVEDNANFQALCQIVYALQLEQVGRGQDAADAYHRALEKRAPNLPAEVIGARLKQATSKAPSTP